MDSSRRTALVTDALFIVTFVTSIPAVFLLYPPVLNDANYVVGGGADAGVALGALLEVLLIIALGIVSLLSVVTLRRDFAGATGGDSSSFVTVGKSLVAIHDWTFLLGPGFIVGVGNGLTLAI